jgi:small subunit ribosomal protein S6
LHTYETVFITIPTLTEDEEKSTVETFARIVADGGGTMHANDRMGRRRLAYPIKKFEDGVYVRFLYDSGSEVPRELERRMKIADEVIRVLTVRLERDWAKDAKDRAVRDAEERAAAAAAAEAQAAEEARRAEEEARAATEAPADSTEEIKEEEPSEPQESAPGDATEEPSGDAAEPALVEKAEETAGEAEDEKET